MRSLRARVLSEACAVGLEARLRTPDAGRVQRLCVQAAGLAAEDDAGAVIAAFGAVFAGARYDRAVLAAAGEDLLRGALRAVLAAAGEDLLRGALRALMPAPVDAGRVEFMADVRGSLGVHSAADQALVHALSFLLAQGVRDDATDDALAVLDDVRGRCSRGFVHVAAMADVAGRLVLYGRVRSRGGCEWAMVLREAGRVMQAYHYAGLAAAVRRAGCSRAG